MSKNRSQTEDRNKSQMELILDYFLDIPTTIYVKWILLGLLLLVGLCLWKVATRQYSPIVQKIQIAGDNWHSAQAMTLEAFLYYDKEDEKFFNFYGNQFIHYHAAPVGVPCADSVPEEVNDAVPGDYTMRLSTTVSFSGKDVKPETPLDRWGDWREINAVNGASRYVGSNDGHSLTQEIYYDETGSTVDIGIGGMDLFSDTRSSNPYIAFHLQFENISGPGWINFYYARNSTDLGIMTKENCRKHYAAPLKIVSVYPEPDIVTPTMFSFQTNMDKILQNGLYVILEDLSMKRENERELFISSIFLGVVVSFFVQLLISLIWDTRDNKRRKRLGKSAGN